MARLCVLSINTISLQMTEESFAAPFLNDNGLWSTIKELNDINYIILNTHFVVPGPSFSATKRKATAALADYVQ